MSEQGLEDLISCLLAITPSKSTRSTLENFFLVPPIPPDFVEISAMYVHEDELYVTNSKVYGTWRLNASLTRALQ